MYKQQVCGLVYESTFLIEERKEGGEDGEVGQPAIRQIPVRSGFSGSRKAPQYVVTLRNRVATIAAISAHLGFKIR
jgi:hypothetical protein